MNINLARIRQVDDELLDFEEDEFTEEITSLILIMISNGIRPIKGDIYLDSENNTYEVSWCSFYFNDKNPSITVFLMF